MSCGDFGAPPHILCPTAEVEQWVTKRPEVLVAVRGLANYGTTCFLNSVLQVVIHTPGLEQYLLHGGHSRSCPSRLQNEWCVLCEVELVARYHDPRQCVRHLKQIMRTYSYGQEDAHEFYRHLLDKMNEVIIRSSARMQPSREAQASVLKALRTDYLTASTTFLFQLFAGWTVQQVVCGTCHTASTTHQMFLDLSLQINAPHIRSIEDALHHHCSEELLTKANQYSCDVCRTYTSAKKRVAIHQPPLILCLQLQRFAFTHNGTTKIGKDIRYPMQFDLKPYTSQYLSRLADAEEHRYQLYGVLLHCGGSAQSGHYNAYVRVGGQWRYCDDNYVQTASESQVMAGSPYMLFYQRVQNTRRRTPLYTPLPKGAIITTNSSPAHAPLSSPTRPPDRPANGGPLGPRPANGTANGAAARPMIGPQLPPHLKPTHPGNGHAAGPPAGGARPASAAGLPEPAAKTPRLSPAPGPIPSTAPPPATPRQPVANGHRPPAPREVTSAPTPTPVPAALAGHPLLPEGEPVPPPKASNHSADALKFVPRQVSSSSARPSVGGTSATGRPASTPHPIPQPKPCPEASSQLTPKPPTPSVTQQEHGGPGPSEHSSDQPATPQAEKADDAPRGIIQAVCNQVQKMAVPFKKAFGQSPSKAKRQPGLPPPPPCPPPPPSHAAPAPSPPTTTTTATAPAPAAPRAGPPPARPPSNSLTALADLYDGVPEPQHSGGPAAQPSGTMAPAPTPARPPLTATALSLGAARLTGGAPAAVPRPAPTLPRGPPPPPAAPSAKRDRGEEDEAPAPRPAKAFRPA